MQGVLHGALMRGKRSAELGRDGVTRGWGGDVTLTPERWGGQGDAGMGGDGGVPAPL